MTRYAGLEHGVAKVSTAIPVNDNSPSLGDSGKALICVRVCMCDGNTVDVILKVVDTQAYRLVSNKCESKYINSFVHSAICCPTSFTS